MAKLNAIGRVSGRSLNDYTTKTRIGVVESGKLFIFMGIPFCLRSLIEGVMGCSATKSLKKLINGL